ncbi:MAG: ABC-F family ATP-binding cassette domain-containing protein [Candidatus Zophobacter franzmannii]|nr:ABC-F family ATP-binding cassette domain-containing protein [Candidatus Zophobacter franzmannii]
MSLVAVNNLGFSFGGRELFKDLSLTIEADSRIGLVGVNGCGKTTLFNLIMGKMVAESGEILKAGSCQFAFLRQENELFQIQTLHEEVMTSRHKMFEIESELNLLHIQMEEHSDEAMLIHMTELQEQFEVMGGFTFETEMKLVLTNLNFPESEWERPISSFSGGEQSRIQLAKILLAPHNLMLLDEPTNHLDAYQIEFLKNYLMKNPTPYIIISHDRYFLDETVTSILEIRGKKLKRYRGNYSAFVLQSEENRVFEEKMWLEQQKYIEKEEDFIRRNLAGQKTKQAQGRRKILERTERLDRPDNVDKFNLGLRADSRSGKDLFRIEDLSIGFPNKILASGIDLYAGYKDRIAIIGPNGCGKSTLLKILLGEMKPLKGELKSGSNLRIGFYGQMQEEMNPDLTVMETIWELAPGEAQGYVLGYLARYGFREDEVKKLVKSLSGGEKARLNLAVLIHSKPNLLILDEPTNHLDIYMIDSLEEALREFDGSLIFVSHDRYFINKIATKKWVFNENTMFETIDDFQTIMTKLWGKKNQDTTASKNTKPKNEKRRINPLVLERKMKEIENVLASVKELEFEKAQLDAEFAKPKSYSQPERIKKLRDEINAVTLKVTTKRNKLVRLEDQYLEMSSED